MNNITITLIVISVILLTLILHTRQTKDHCKCDFNDVECKTACALKNRKKKKVKFNNAVDKVKIL